ncbi:hypothetical protein SCP_0706340 [Sparassis crispa]|uniref:Uncharacterized protein n=1 Tax=Sparassis crispa TaxID=139825 RepID=A0A401GTA8_9APHY|nr:hypothetical protein SCP_0706340 [Sparassis crispa]GBE85447.1 hypothetical protein SCP_0706340 [Sparassis crispa]
MDASSSHLQAKSVGGKLRNMFTSKSKLLSARPAVSFPSRIPVRKRDIDEVSLDENEGYLTFPPARVRQRLNSGASVVTIRPSTPRAHTPTRKSSFESIRAISPDAKGAKHLPSVTPPAIRARNLPPTNVLRETTCYNSVPAVCAEARTSVTSFPVRLDAAPSPATQFVSKTAGLTSAATATPSTISSSTPLEYTKLHESMERRNERFDTERHSVEDKAIESIREDVPERKVTGDDTDDEVEQLTDISTMPTIPDEEDQESEQERIEVSVIPEVKPYDCKSPSGRFHIHIKPRNNWNTMWDVPDKSFYAWPAMLCVADNKPNHDLFHSRCPIQCYELMFYSVDFENSHIEDADVASERADYLVKYTGQTLAPVLVPTLIDPSRGICTSPVWVHMERQNVGDSPGGTWRLRFWVPIPMALFTRRESRQFRLRARVGLGDYDVPRVVVDSGVVEVGIEHLRKARIMQ